MKRINHLLPPKIRYGLTAIGATLITGKALTSSSLVSNDLFVTLFHSYYLLISGIVLFLIGLLASEEALDSVFGDDQSKNKLSDTLSPGLAEKKNSIFGESSGGFGDGGGDGGG